MRPDIILDRSGDLRHGLFWELGVGDSLALDFQRRDCPGGIYCPLYPSELELMETTGEEYVWARLGGRLRRKEYRNCSSNPEHITRVSFQNLSVDLSFGPRVPDLFHLDCGGEYSILVSPSLAVALEESGFKGFELHKLRFVPKPKIRNYRDIRELQFAGGRCLRPWSIDGHPNLCPWCGQTEVICQSCGQMSLPCSECEKYPWAASKNIKPGDKYLTIPSLETFRPHIIEGHKWDGSDFLYGGVEVGFFAPIVSKRVIDFLQSRHSTSFLARPVDVAVDRMTPEQLKRLEEVSRLPG